MSAVLEQDVAVSKLNLLKTKPSQLSSKDGYVFIENDFKQAVSQAYRWIKILGYTLDAEDADGLDNDMISAYEELYFNNAKCFLRSTHLEDYLGEGIVVGEANFYIDLLNDFDDELERYNKTDDVNTKLCIKAKLLEKMQPYIDGELGD